MLFISSKKLFPFSRYWIFCIFLPSTLFLSSAIALELGPKILRQSAEVTANTLQLLINNAISNSEFFKNLKSADATPVFKKKDPLDKTNYRPVSVLLPVSKMFERLIQKQINQHIKNKLSLYLYRYRKGFSRQYALLSLIEHRKKTLDEKGFGGAVLMDLSKAFDTLNYEQLIAKL